MLSASNQKKIAVTHHRELHAFHNQGPIQPVQVAIMKKVGVGMIMVGSRGTLMVGQPQLQMANHSQTGRSCSTLLARSASAEASM